jgi:hypothetical protein
MVRWAYLIMGILLTVACLLPALELYAGQLSYGVNEFAPSSSPSETSTTWISEASSAIPAEKDFADLTVLSAVEVHIFFGVRKLCYLCVTSTPNFVASNFPALVNISCSASVMGLFHDERKDRTGTFVQSTVVFESFCTKGSM